MVINSRSHLYSSKLIHSGMTGDIEILFPNVALNGTAAQISSYHHAHHFSDPDQAFYAIDGNFATDLNGLRARCAITLQMPGAWWQVDLMMDYLVQKVAITTRKDDGTIHCCISLQENLYNFI